MEYLNCDVNNGEGIRCTLFVSGCELACKGCQNPSSWKLTAGYPYTKEFEDQIIEDLKSPYIEGLSLSGGHPLHPKVFPEVLALCKRVKKEVGKNIWLWTGLTLEELQADEIRCEILEWVDVLVDGSFVQELKDSSLQWKGSRNQRVIDIKEIL